MNVAISAVIPTYREEDTIARAVQAVGKALDRLGGEFEIIVVDNASPDRTVEIVKEAAGDLPIRTLVNPRNLGKGFSVRRGMLAAEGEWRFFCDADLSTPVDEIGRFSELTKGEVPILVGSRLATGSYVVQAQPRLRHSVGRAFLSASHLLFPGLPRDVYCGFKWFRADAADRLFGLLRDHGWVFDLEVLALANRFGIQVVEVPIEWENHADTRLKMSRDWPRIAAEMLQIRMRVSRISRDRGEMLPPAPPRTLDE